MRNALPTGASVGDYANSMFRFDLLNAPWIDRCVTYLKELFGARLQDATVLDYAFGRGNWAIALRLAGARRVVAVDAAEDNCDRLRAWVTEQGITGIEVVHGNVLEAPIDRQVDLCWAHGILPFVQEPLRLLTALRGMLHGANASMHLYAYDRDSMRHWLIDAARRFLCYASEAAFRADAPLFAPAARLRVRDDLTAPCIHWLSLQQLGSMAQGMGLAPQRRHADFSEWLRGGPDEEFQPHNLLLGVSPATSQPAALAEPARPLAGDLRLLAALAQPLFDDTVSRDVGRKHAIGLCNTHFTALANGGMQAALVQDLHYVLYVLLADGHVARLVDPAARQFLALAEAALHDAPRGHWPAGDSACLVPHLQRNTIRL